LFCNGLFLRQLWRFRSQIASHASTSGVIQSSTPAGQGMRPETGGIATATKQSSWRILPELKHA